MEKFDVILLFAYGEGEIINKRLIRFSESIAQLYKIKYIFTQKDIAELKKKMGDHYDAEFIIAPQENNYISSLQIIDCFEEEAKKRQWKDVAIMGAPQHIKRCFRDCCRELPNMRFFNFHEKVPKKTRKEKWYDKNDPQPWVRNPFRWWMQEIIIRLLPYSLYKKITRSKARK